MLRAKFQIFRLVSVAEQTDLNLTMSETTETGLVASRRVHILNSVAEQAN